MLSEDLFSFHVYGTKYTRMFVPACYPNYWSIISINPNSSYKRIIKKEWFIQRSYGKSIFLQLLLLLLLMLHIHKYLFGLFLKASFSSTDAVLTCIFLGTFCLKPHFRRIRYMWVKWYLISLFFMINSSSICFVVQPWLLSFSFCLIW